MERISSFINDDQLSNLTYSTVVGLVREGENSQVKKNSKSDDDTKPSHDYSTLTDFARLRG